MEECIVMSKEFIVTPKNIDDEENTYINMTLRMKIKIQKEFDELAKKSKRSRNELMCMALEYALENLKFTTKIENNDEYENSDKEA